MTLVSLESLVPSDHIVRLMEKHIDFSFIDKRTEGLYSTKGRPSVAPQILIRMMLIGYLHGITSERRLCQEVHLNLAYRWFCGLSLEDKVPHHSTFSKNRHGRFAGTALFRELFYEIVQQATDKGLVRGKHLSTDATLIDANAAMHSLEPIVVHCEKEAYWQQLDEESCNEPEEPQTDSTSNLVDASEKKGSINQTQRSRTDPDSRVATRWGAKHRLAYSGNYLTDNANNLVIDVEVTSPSLTDECLSSVEMLKRSQFRFGLNPKDIGADSAYARGEVLTGFMEAGVNAYTPKPQDVPRSKMPQYGKDRFKYDESNDQLMCPQGYPLRKVKDRSKPRLIKYVASEKHCRDCPLKAHCTQARRRTVQLHVDQEALDWAEALRNSSEYKISQFMRRRIERLFGEAKEQMGLRRARRRGLEQVQEQCLMTAMAQNIKRIVNLSSPKALFPAKLGLSYNIWVNFSALLACFRQIDSSRTSNLDIFSRSTFRLTVCA